jgi:hypothetical protein
MYGSDVASSNRNDGTNTKAVFAQQVNKPKSLGYVEIQPMMDSTQWHDYYKSRTSLTNGEVYVSACKPQNCYGGMTVSNEFALRDPPTFLVTIDQISNVQAKWRTKRYSRRDWSLR